MEGLVDDREEDVDRCEKRDSDEVARVAEV
jgi:hypothetical protein